LYFVGPKITESVARDPEYAEMFRLMSTCGRLLNYVQTYEVCFGKEKKLDIYLVKIDLHSNLPVLVTLARHNLYTTAYFFL
jgi:acyclic sesquiterpene synthase